MISIDPKALQQQNCKDTYKVQLGPRPIAFASTVDADGNLICLLLVSLMYLVQIRLF
jgi:hypothetical protein